MMKRLLSLLLSGLLFVSISSGAKSEPVLVELFTSQSCYSCPPAEAFLAELATDPGNVLALEWHVDYWNDLVYGSAGQWRDPYSSQAFTQRQRSYNLRLRNTGSVYTPQMVIGGSKEVVGSHKRKAFNAIAAVNAKPGQGPAISSRFDDQGRIEVTIKGRATPAYHLYRIDYFHEVATKVQRGENHGKSLFSRNVVNSMVDLGSVASITGPVILDVPEKGKGCAFIVQEPGAGEVLSVAHCPSGRQS